MKVNFENFWAPWTGSDLGPGSNHKTALLPLLQKVASSHLCGLWTLSCESDKNTFHSSSIEANQSNTTYQLLTIFNLVPNALKTSFWWRHLNKLENTELFCKRKNIYLAAHHFLFLLNNEELGKCGWRRLRGNQLFITALVMNSMKLVIPLHFISWKKTQNDAVTPQRGTAFAFIFGVNWLWRHGVTASFWVFFHE